MFSAAPAGSLNDLHRLDAREQQRFHRRGLAQAAADQQSTHGYLAQFAAYWQQVKDSLAAMLALPAQLQSAANDMQAARQAAIDAGDADTASTAEVLYNDILAHQAPAAQTAAQIQQYRDTWNSIAASLSGTWGELVSTVESWWLTAKQAVGLGLLPLIPLAVLIAAVSALGVVAVTGLAVLAWWRTTAATIEGVKAKTLPASALGSGGLLSGVSSTMMWAAAGIAGILALVLVNRK